VSGAAPLSALRERLLEAAKVVAGARSNSTVQCACEDYCTGSCFAASCVACPAATWSFPGGSSLCLDAGPLGTGLLCQAGADGLATQSACCGQDAGGPCALPEGSCCASGSCETCPKYPAKEALFLELDDLDTRHDLRRHFDLSSNTCLFAEPSQGEHVETSITV
ncbi:unnamed protein product, partial [Polarella glacialis]